MDKVLLNYFVLNNELYSTYDFSLCVLNKKGIQVYEVIRVIDAKPLFWDEHLKRFYHSAKLMGVKIPLNDEQIAQKIKTLIEANRLENGNIEFLYEFDKEYAGRFVAWVSPFFYPSEKQYKEGVKTATMPATREQPNAKAFNRSLRETTDKYIMQNKVYEVLLHTPQGTVTEGSRSNVFFIKSERLLTPSLSMVLPGVTRSKVIGIAHAMDIKIEEKEVNISSLHHFDSCFLSGTSSNILPVKQINEMYFDVDNRLMRKLMQHFNRLMKNYLAHYDFN